MSPPNQPSVSVCFPAFNEQATIGSVLNEAHQLLSVSDLDYEILVCNDGSTDDTGTIAEQIASELTRIRVLHNERNRGIRETFERLYRESRKDFVFLNSTDRQWETRILFNLLPMVSEFDIVIAARKTKHYGVIRGIVSRLFNLIPELLFGVKTHDAGAVKLVRREIIERFELVSRSPFSEAERLIRAQRAGFRIASYPVDTAERKTGKARGVSLRAVRLAAADVIRVFFDLRRENDSKPQYIRRDQL